MNKIRTINNINEEELNNGMLSYDISWHYEHKDEAYIYIGNLNKELTEGDVLTVFSQFGVPVDLKLVRDKNTGDSKGFAYLKYEDARSAVLAIDNMNGVKIANRSVVVDHIFYKPGRDDTIYQKSMKDELSKDYVKHNLKLKR